MMMKPIILLTLLAVSLAQICELPTTFDCNRTDPYCPQAQ